MENGQTWWGSTSESLSLSFTSAYPRLASVNEEARRAAEEMRRNDDMVFGQRQVRVFPDFLPEDADDYNLQN